MCSSCDATFPQPNMLKAHLRLNWCTYDRSQLPALRQANESALHNNSTRLQDALLQDDSTTQGTGGIQDIRVVDDGLAMTPDTNTSNDEDEDNDNATETPGEGGDDKVRKKGHMCMFCGKIYSRR